MENKKNKNRKKALLIVGVLLAVFILIGASFAYYNASVTKVNETETNINTIVLGAGECNDVVMECLDVVPGDQCTKEFSITNTNANTPLVANIYMRDIENEFASDLDDLVYTLKDKDTGEIIINETVVPDSQADEHYLLKNISIPGNTTKTYEFVVTYKYLANISQNSFQGSEFKAGFCADTLQIKEEPKEGKTCNGGDECTKTGDIVDPYDATTEKYDVLIEDPTDNTMKTVSKENPTYPKRGDDEEKPDFCTEELYKKRIYGTQVVIHHDLYYADQELYSTGKNKRYVTYCRPYKEGTKQGVEYCSKSNGKDCISSNSTVCSYENAMKDLGNSKVKYQAFVEEFADRDNGNWHIAEYCQTAAKKTAWPGNGNGLYYCNKDKTVLHDWYANSTSSANDVNNTKNSCEQETEWNPGYFGYGDWDTVSTPVTHDVPPSNHNVYTALDGEGNYGVCIKRNGQRYCFKADDYDAEKIHMQQVFSDVICYSSDSDENYYCNASDFECALFDYGRRVECYEDISLDDCSVDDGGYAYCIGDSTYIE